MTLSGLITLLSDSVVWTTLAPVVTGTLIWGILKFVKPEDDCRKHVNWYKSQSTVRLNDKLLYVLNADLLDDIVRKHIADYHNSSIVFYKRYIAIQVMENIIHRLYDIVFMTMLFSFILFAFSFSEYVKSLISMIGIIIVVVQILLGILIRYLSHKIHSYDDIE